MPTHPEPIATQLAAALDKTEVSQAELARRLAKMDGKEPESKRRWIQKILKDDEMIPEKESLADIESALALKKGYFKPPTRQAVAARRATTEEEVEYLRLAAGVLLDMVVLLCEQVTKLGGEIPAEMLESSALEVLRRHRKAGAL